MEIKEWKEYSKEEKSTLLHHWWYYYGKVVITFAEWEKFNKMVEEDSDQIFLLAIASYINGSSNEPLVWAIRENKVDQLMSTLPKLEEIDDEKFKTIHSQIEKSLISTLVESYNNPEPDIPMDVVVVVKKKEKNNPNINRRGFVN